MNTTVTDRLKHTSLVISCAGLLSTPSALAQGYPMNSYATPQRSYTGFAGSNPPLKVNKFCSVNQMRAQQDDSRRKYGNSTMGALEQMLDTVDTAANWYGNSISNTTQRISQPQANPNPSRIMPNHSKQEVMRVFLEGGYPNSTPPSRSAFGSAPAPQNNSGNSSNAYSNYKTAENEATKARNYANTARYDSNQWNRKNAASQAEYAANNANYAAQRAESAAYSGNAQAQSYANLARQAANRARESANRARYNADTIR